MSFGRQVPTSIDDVTPEARDKRLELAAAVDEQHLCSGCLHAPVCAVASAVRVLGADDQIVISKCGAFVEMPEDPSPASP